MELSWGPYYWYFIHTSALNYPKTPNEVTKKKYYDFIMNLPLFIPNEKIGNQFSKLLDKYPVTPYLDSRDAFVKWTHFIHNRVNIITKKNTLSYQDFINLYTIKPNEKNKTKSYSLYIIILISLFILFIIYR